MILLNHNKRDVTHESVVGFINTERSKAILILDDEDATHDLFTAALGSVGYQILHRRKGKEAIEQIKRRHFDLLVTDIVMPEQDGLETITIVRKSFPCS